MADQPSLLILEMILGREVFGLSVRELRVDSGMVLVCVRGQDLVAEFGVLSLSSARMLARLRREDEGGVVETAS